MDFTTLWIATASVGGVALLSSLRILYEYQRGVIFRLGRLTSAIVVPLLPTPESGGWLH